MNDYPVVDWQQSPAHIWFLTTFLEPHAPDDHYLGVDWQRALGEPPGAAINRFRKVLLVIDAPFAVRLEAQYTAADLKELCRAYNLPVSGATSALIARLEEANDPAIFAQATIEMYQCSDYGRKLVERHLTNPGSVIQQVARLPILPEDADGQLTRDDLKRTLRWLLVEGIVLGVAGDAAYDLLKALLESAGERIRDVLPDFSASGLGGVSHLTLTLKIEWCPVSAAPFLMGSTGREPDAHADERPQHSVRLSAFSIAKYPVTNAQYAAFMRATGHPAPWFWKDGRFTAGKANHPLTGVSWDDANAFCSWARSITGRAVRLPTEAEWEKAARGTDGRRYPWGNTWDDRRCNSGQRHGDTTPVDRFPRGRSPYGLFDMAGNVWEWTSSIYKPYPYSARDGREDPSDKAAMRVLRGGSWWSNSDLLRCASRYRRDRSLAYGGGGFRVVVSPLPTSDL